MQPRTIDLIKFKIKCFKNFKNKMKKNFGSSITIGNLLKKKIYSKDSKMILKNVSKND